MLPPNNFKPFTLHHHYHLLDKVTNHFFYNEYLKLDATTGTLCWVSHLVVIEMQITQELLLHLFCQLENRRLRRLIHFPKMVELMDSKTQVYTQVTQSQRPSLLIASLVSCSNLFFVAVFFQSAVWTFHFSVWNSLMTSYPLQEINPNLSSNFQP